MEDLPMQAITDIIVNERDFPTNLQISNNITNSQKTSSFSFEDVLSFVKNEMPKTESADSSSVKEKTESVKTEKQTDISEKIAEKPEDSSKQVESKVEEKIASEEDTQKVDEQKDKKIVLKDENTENTEKSDIKKSSDKKVLVKSEQKNQIEAEFSRMNNLVQNQEKNISEIHAEKISTEELKINFDGKKAKFVQEEKNDSTEENIVFAELLNSDISENQIDFTEQKFSKDITVKSKKVQTLDKDGKISVTDLRTKEAEINEDFAQTQKDFTSEVKFEDDNSATITMNLNQENVETNLLSTSNQTAASDGSNFQAMLNNQIKANAPEFVKTGSIVLRDNNQGTINLILHPDEIGSVKIHLSLDGKTVSGQITVATKEAMEVFKNNAETLREAFIQQGFDVGGFDVAYSDNGSFSNQEQFAQENNEKLMANYAQNCYESGTDEVFENFDENTNKFSDYSINIVA
ncbi:MAG: hypothetical protein E7060_00050 [Treponema bryantii]|nr:hypothetical protein [Treponema bryantii]